MRFDDCPVCKGELVAPFFKRPGMKLEDYPNKIGFCRTCIDEHGNPTGRVCVMEEGDIRKIDEAVYSLGRNTRYAKGLKRILRACDDELKYRTHRKEGGR